MKRLLPILILSLILLLTAGLPCQAEPALNLTAEETAWLEVHRGEPLALGLDPYSGLEYFTYQDGAYGFGPELARLLEAQLGLRIDMVADRSWGEVFSGLQTGEVDILLGANETPERLKTMAFTEPILKYPYAVFSRKNSGVQTLGDLDGKRLGFIEGDFVLQRLPESYPNIRIEPRVYPDQYAGLQGMLNGETDGFITSGGGIKYDFLYNYPESVFVGEIPAITSDLTLSTRRSDAVLAGILTKFIQANREGAIADIIREAEQKYNRKILHLTPQETEWLDSGETVQVGLADDYLPFDYDDDGNYRGISGAVLERISEMTGIRFAVVRGSFSDMYDAALEGRVDILNLAMTEDRKAHFIYPRPISTERDIIIGLKGSDPVFDIYGLEGKRIAVIEGFWHEEYLRKNLQRPDIIITKDIVESLKAVRSGRADYLIENPTVSEYYINGLGYTELVKKGTASKDSFVYLGVTRRNPELASIMDKALVLIDYEEMKYLGIQSVPPIQNERNRQLAIVIALLVVVLAVGSFYTVRTMLELVRQRAQMEFLREREKLIYTDTLTGLSNRTCYNHLEQEFKGRPCPQTVIISDLNGLKRVNDTYGHHMGDALIVAFAEALKASLPPEAPVFRMGGDEFLIVLDGCGEPEAQKCIEGVRRACAERCIPLADNSEIRLEAAFGYCVRSGPEVLLEECLIAADNDMYRDKRRDAAGNADRGLHR